MAEADLEEFVVYQGQESIAATLRNQGTNASRFAIAGALTAPVVSTLDDTIPLIDTDSLVRFGFNPNLSSISTPVGLDSTESVYSEARTFIDQRDSWGIGDGRVQAWNELAEGGNLRARLMLLAAGLSSELERESAAAAVAIVGLLRGNVALERPPRGPWNLLRYWWWRPWTETWPWMWVDETGSPLSESLDDFDQRAGEWHGDQWREFTDEMIAAALEIGDEQTLLWVLLWIANTRVGEAARSEDSVVREFAYIARWSRSDDTPGDYGTSLRLQSARPYTSTMLHGTWGWKGDWWYPGGDFHSYVKLKYRPHLYDEGMEFSWSGAYSQKQRASAGERFSRWARSCAPLDGLGTVFAHSYGGEIAARAINSGTRVQELVLLSAPVNAHHLTALGRVSRVVDVRLKFDIVLALARENQQFPSDPKVTPCVVDRAFWKHGATHAPEFWNDENVAARVGL
jgi:hypothetical protein